MTRRTITGAVVLAVTVVLIPPASAAMPTAPASKTMRCANGKMARVWDEAVYPDYAYDDDGTPDQAYATHVRVAAQNPCKGQWLQLEYWNESVSKPAEDIMWLAPGAKFNRDQPYLKRSGADDLYPYGPQVSLVEPKEVCVPMAVDEPDYDYSAHSIGKIYSYNDVRPAQQCAMPKYQPSQTETISCDAEAASLTWKKDGKKLIKIAVRNRCPFDVAVEWIENGRSVVLLARRGQSFDLWKTELDPMPRTKVKGGPWFAPGEGCLRQCGDQLWGVDATGKLVRLDK